MLVVDDDAAMRDLVSDYLGSHHFRVSAVPDGDGMMRVLRDADVDLVILDMKLAHEDGLDLMRRLGTPPEAPVIIVTGHRRDEADRIVGLELGADDYVTKPFSPRELLARVRAVLRRAEAADRRARTREKKARYRFSGWELDMQTRRLTSPDGEELPLTSGECNLLVAFLKAPQRVQSREQLLAASRVHDHEVFDRSIDVQILRLRRKLERDPSRPTLIRTERGSGYVFTAQVEKV
ncbi:MAG TPA: response regulator [Woeseiaceae bacterium]|nr:response regulator [Woeseiaceae bacterium]